MTEERIGGIGVSVGGDWAELEAVLTAAEKRLKAFTKDYGNVGVNIGGTASAGRSGGGASNEQLTTAITQLTHQLSVTRFGGGRTADPYALSVVGGSGGKARIDLGDLSTKAQEEVRKAVGGIAAASRPAARMAPVQAQQVVVNSARPIDLTAVAAFSKSLSGLAERIDSLAALAGPGAPSGPAGSFARPSASEVEREERIRIGVRRRDAGTRAQGSDGEAPGAAGVRRKNLRDRGIGTEVRPGMVYTYEPDEGAEKEIARQRQTAVTADMYAKRPSGNIGLLRAVGGQLGRRVSSSRYDYAAANTPSPGAPDAGPPGFAPQVPSPQYGRSTRQETPEEEEARRRREQKAQADAAAFDRKSRTGRGTPGPRGPVQPLAATPESEFGAEVSAEQLRRVLGAQYARQVVGARIQRQSESGTIMREADILTQGRTSRTGASGLAGFIFGGRRGEVEARGKLGLAEQDVQSAQRQKGAFDAVIRDYEIAGALGDKNAAGQIKAIKNTTLYKHAVDDLTGSEQRHAAAAADVAKYTEGMVPAARNLAAVTIGGAAFGLGLEAVNKAGEALVPALANLVDIQTGFGATSTRVTTALGTQTLAMKGNAAEALAAAQAQAGLSTSASDYLNTQLLLPTQIKAGAQAQAQASDLARASYGAKNAPTGLYGGYGGLLGSGLFAQQMGGGMGFTERVNQDIGAFSPAATGDIGSMLGQAGGQASLGLSYLANSGIRSAINSASRDQGNILGNIMGVAAGQVTGGPGGAAQAMGELFNPTAQVPAAETAASAAYRGSLNTAATRGQAATGDTQLASYGFTTDQAKIAQAEQAAAAAGDAYGASLAKNYGYVVQLDGAVVKSGDDYQKAAAQFAVGQGIQDPGQMGRASLIAEQQRQVEARASVPAIMSQQAYALPSFIGQQVRTAQYAQGTQQPFQAYLANLAAPPPRVGSTLAAANAGEQAKVNAGILQAQGLQNQLDAYYAKGQQAVRATYDPGVLQMFGAQGQQVFDGLLGSVQQVGSQMASIQTSINMEQASYAAAQYSEQIRLAKISLSDIVGLTGAVQYGTASEVGILERQNLLLGRQGQMLQFQMSQRQINLQVATAGFQVPGLTPAEQAARVEEAKVEAGFAQKQLDIQKSMFGNQVKIVDITNLRQAQAIFNSLGLLQQGRAVTLDIAIKQESLTRLSKLQSDMTAQLQGYASSVDALQAKSISNQAEQEAALGSFIRTVGSQAAAVAFATGQALYLGVTGGMLPVAPTPIYHHGGTTGTTHAAGIVGTTTGSTTMTVGEAGSETVAVLRNPRQIAAPGGSGGQQFTIPVTVYLDGERIYKSTLRRMGRDAAARGLRGPN